MKAVLTVEDQPILRRLIRMTLEFDGYAVWEALTGESGVELARMRRPDLVLMDLTLPGGIDGIEAMRRIRAVPGCESLPIVVLTAQDAPAAHEAARSAGATGYLVKPFRPLELAALTARLIGEA